MSEPYKVTKDLTAHIPGGDPKLFNFVGPRSRRWAKAKAKEKRDAELDKPEDAQEVSAKMGVAKVAGQEGGAAEPWNWEPWTMMGRMGYDEEAMTPESGAYDPLTARRLLPHTEQAQGDPAYFQALVYATQIANKASEEYLNTAGNPEDGWLSRTYKSFLSPEAEAFSPERIAQGHEDVKGRVVNEVLTKLIEDGVPEDVAARRAQQAAEAVVGTRQQFQERLSARTATGGEVGGMSAGSLAPMAYIGAAPLGVALKGLEMVKSPAWRMQFGDPKDPRTQAATDLEEAKFKGKLTGDVDRGDVGTGVGDVLAAPFTTFGINPWAPNWGSYDQGVTQMATGLEKLRTLGTVQNRLGLEKAMDTNRRQEALRAGRIGQRSIADSGWTPDSFDAAKARWAEANSGGSPAARRALQEYQYSAKDPSYRNLMTLDFGGMPAQESARTGLSQLMTPSRWGGAIKDYFTGGDTTHDMMMKGKDWGYEDPGTGRFKPYQDMAAAMAKGDYDLARDDISGVQLAGDEGELSWMNPARYLGWKNKETTGPITYGQLKEQNLGKMRAMEYGQLSAGDVDAIEQHVGQDPRARAALDLDRRKTLWAKNRASGNRTVEALSANLSTPAVYAPPAPSSPTKPVATQPLPPPAAGAPVEKVAAEPADPQEFPQPEHFQEWYKKYQAGQPLGVPRFPDWRRYQTKLRGKMRQDILGAAQDPDSPENAYGQGLRERWSKSGPGRYADNYYAPVGGLFSQSDRTFLDPVLRKHRARLEEGDWKPGMMVEPLINKHQMGWTSPLGRLGEFFGYQDTPEKQMRTFTQQIIKSPKYLKLRSDLSSGLLSLRDFLYQTRGVPVLRYDPELAKAVTTSRRAAAGVTGGRVADFFNLAETPVDNEMSALNKATTL